MNFKRACVSLPLFFFGFRLFAFYTDPFLHLEDYVKSEYGFYENLTVVFLLLAVVLTIKILSQLKGQSLPLKKFVLLGFIAGCIYYAGEEVSWGQHFFLWQTPEAWEQINKQNETNIHNTYAIFDHFPRELLIAGLIFYCVCLPLASLCPSWRNGYWPNRFGWLYPESRLTMVAVLMLVTRLPDRIVKVFSGIDPIPYPINPKEFQELFIALTLFLIAWGILTKAKKGSIKWAPEKPSKAVSVSSAVLITPIFFICMRPMSMLFFLIITLLFLAIHYFASHSTSKSASKLTG